MKIVSFCLTPSDSNFIDLTRRSVQNYAERIGAKYEYIPLADALKEFENGLDCILWLSPSILVNPKADDVRKFLPKHGVSLFDEGRFRLDHSKYSEFVAGKLGEKSDQETIKLYNTDVMLIYPDGADVFQKAPVKLEEGETSYWINYVCQKRKDRVNELPFRFNRTMSVERFVGESRFKSAFINYRGLAEDMGEAHALVTLSRDIAELEKGLEYKSNFMVELSGGLGDVVESEPAVRFLAKKLCPNENIVLVTRTPEVFEHLGLKMYHADVEVPDRGSYLKLMNMGAVEDIFFHFIMPHDTHFCDLAAQRMIKRTVPIQERQIQLGTPQSLPSEQAFPWERAVILHPGKGWASKTFPAHVWEGYAARLLMKGLNVVIVGQRIDERQGYVDVDMRNIFTQLKEGSNGQVIDLRDKLSLRQLFWVISRCPVLISNDSAPVHIAGAYENAIGLIATCKHPDYILPYRHGDPYYKAKNLERRKLYLEMRLPPNYIDSATVDHAEPEDILEAVPTAEQVLEFATQYIT